MITERPPSAFAERATRAATPQTTPAAAHTVECDELPFLPGRGPRPALVSGMIPKKCSCWLMCTARLVRSGIARHCRRRTPTRGLRFGPPLVRIALFSLFSMTKVRSSPPNAEDISALGRESRRWN